MPGKKPCGWSACGKVVPAGPAANCGMQASGGKFDGGAPRTIWPPDVDIMPGCALFPTSAQTGGIKCMYSSSFNFVVSPNPCNA